MRFGRIAFEVLLVIALAMACALLWLEGRKIRTPFLPHYVFSYDPPTGVLHVQGTWRLEDGDDAYPSQTTTLLCEKSKKSCSEASAILADNLMLPVGINSLPTTRWDDQFIVIRGPKAVCAEEFYTVEPLAK